MSLRYENGALVTGATRGDGSEGEDVTANVKTLADIPQRLKGKGVPAVCEVRGEVYMTKAAFLDLNRKQAEAGKPLYVNPRNTAAGSLRQLDPTITASRPLGFFAYAWGEMSEMPADTQSGMIKWFAACGFKTNPLTKMCRSVEALAAISIARSKRSAAASTTTSTAWSTRSTASTGRSGSASCRAIRAGRSRTNFRRNRPPLSSKISRSKSAAPAF